MGDRHLILVDDVDSLLLLEVVTLQLEGLQVVRDVIEIDSDALLFLKIYAFYANLRKLGSHDTVEREISIPLNQLEQVNAVVLLRLINLHRDYVLQGDGLSLNPFEVTREFPA